MIDGSVPDINDYIEDNMEEENETTDEEPEYLGRIVRNKTPPRTLTIRDPARPPFIPIRRAVRQLLSNTSPVLFFQPTFPTFLGHATTDATADSSPRVYRVYKTAVDKFYALFSYTLPCGQHLYPGQDPRTYM